MPHLTVTADPKSLVRPRPASGGARLKVVVARKAEDLKVLLAVVPALQHRQPVMHVQNSLCSQCAADLARPAARRDQRPPARCGQRFDARPSIARGQQAVASGAAAHQRSPLMVIAGRAPAAKDQQVGRAAGRVLVEPDHIQGPPPFEPACLACSRASALKRDANARSKSHSTKHAFGPRAS